MYSNSDKGDDYPLSEIRSLVLYNDDINEFDYVIATLCKECGHSMLQAEQCASIAHYKGKCQIKRSEAALLRHIKNRLIKKGLKVIIE